MFTKFISFSQLVLAISDHLLPNCTSTLNEHISLWPEKWLDYFTQFVAKVTYRFTRTHNTHVRITRQIKIKQTKNNSNYNKN